MRTADTPAAVPTERRLWRAVLARDPRFDGRVWMAVRSTGIYCLPSCRSRRPRRENVRFFASAAEAERAGFRACRRCRPELAGGRRGLERAELERWLARIAAEDAPLAELLRAGGVSRARLYRLFRRHLDEGPRRARARVRLEHACRLLAAPGGTVAEAAFAAGFGSLATFYRWFRRTTGATPSAWRARARKVRRNRNATHKSNGN
jgi:methylphosphotriester-DNA--protein-cysteine methyltransferase